ncbi:hypothetical protein PFUGPA_05363 [Plasmodium falciparum Palo Alto/Uganda]|uniref:Uncharacterized protein n=1 Tax=Plasmodium falciparum (isolate Palo Alto / Uganda) TaxID=57270 RepID=W4IQN5_PLAFP|nr:hypothetical protein PFUGPA_05363 [Plasmodium falciparum Palo Alto/Uganda]
MKKTTFIYNIIVFYFAMEHGGYAHGHRQRRMGTDTESDSINSAKTDTENGTGAAKYYALRKIQKSI